MSIHEAVAKAKSMKELDIILRSIEKKTICITKDNGIYTAWIRGVPDITKNAAT